MCSVCRTPNRVSATHTQQSFSNNLQHPCWFQSFSFLYFSKIPTAACLHNSHSSSPLSHFTLLTKKKVELILKELEMEEYKGSEVVGRTRLENDEEGKLRGGTYLGSCGWYSCR